MIDGSPENLRKLANPRCKKCHGLGRLGFKVEKAMNGARIEETAIALACKCVSKHKEPDEKKDADVPRRP